jgi:hypothetical protein
MIGRSGAMTARASNHAGGTSMASFSRSGSGFPIKRSNFAAGRVPQTKERHHTGAIVQD